jgi:predicted transcriptional regulator
MSATTLVIDDALAERVARIAEDRDLSIQMLMVSAISDYVERAEARAKLVREGDEAWAEYRRTGLHLTGDEIQDWLKSWAADKNAVAPKCHE